MSASVMTELAIPYLAEAIDDRTEIEWFTDAPTGPSLVAAPLDVYFRTTAGEVTWGWSIEGIPLDAQGRRFRRLRHPDGWVMFFDADDPELIVLDTPFELHSVLTAGLPISSVELERGKVPEYAQALALARTGHDPAARYRLDPAWAVSDVNAALRLWSRAVMGRELHFRWAPAGEEDRQAITELAGAESVGLEPGEGPIGYDAEIAEILGGYEAITWTQSELTWPDAGDQEAFRDRIDVQMQDEAGNLAWLVAVEPPQPGMVWLETGGLRVGLDPDDPARLALDHDRLILAVSRPSDGYEPAGLAVETGRAPSSEQWAELRGVRDRHDGCVLVWAPAWSEGVVSEALAVWAKAWGSLELGFRYDFNDPAAQAALDANNALEDALPASPSVRTAAPNHCMYSEPPTLTYEDPLPCGRRGTHYYEENGKVIVVCGEHVPDGRNVTVLMRA